MKYSSFNDTVLHENSPTCHVREHILDDLMADCAIANLNGRYPESGWAMNKISKEVAFVQEGEGSIVIGDKSYPLSKGDCVLIQPDEKFYWHGQMTLLLFCTPKWTIEQHQHVEN